MTERDDQNKNESNVDDQSTAASEGASNPATDKRGEPGNNPYLASSTRTGSDVQIKGGTTLPPNDEPNEAPTTDKPK